MRIMPDDAKPMRVTVVTLLMGGALVFGLVAGGFLLDTFDLLPPAWKPLVFAMIGVALMAVVVAMTIVLNPPKSN